MKPSLFNRIITGLCVILLCSITSCEYHPKGIYEVELDQITEAPAIQVSLNFKSDTLFIPLDKYIKLEYSVTDTLIRYAFFSINEQQLAQVELNSGFFATSFLSAHYQTNTAYKLKIEFFRSSGSKSLADKLMKEGFVYSKEVIVFFENHNGKANIPTIIGTTAEEGSLKITWKKYTGVGFIRYHVYSGMDHKIAMIDDANINYCFDPNFIGYQTAFQVITETEFESYRSPMLIFQDVLPKIQLKKLDEDRISLHWGKSKYEANISGYKIIEGFDIFDRQLNEIAYKEIGNNDTSLVYSDGKFGVKTMFFLLPVRKIEPQIIKYRSDLESLGSKTEYYNFGTTFNDGGNLCTPLGDFAYFSGYIGYVNYLYKYNCITQQFVDSISSFSGQIASSPDGKILLAGGYKTLKLIDSQTLITKNTINVDKLTNPVYYDFLKGFLISNTGSGVYIDVSGDYVSYDFLNARELTRFRIDGQTNDSDHCGISGDGQYFCIQHIKDNWNTFYTELYELKNGTAIKIWSDNEIKYFEIDQKSNNLAFLKNNKLYMMSLVDQTILSEIDVQDPYFMDIDWNNREYITLNANRDLLSIYNLDSGTIKAHKKTLSYDSSDITFQNLKLFNHTLFSPFLRMHLNY